MPTAGEEIPIQRVPSGFPGPGGIGFASFAQSEAGGYHHGFRHLTMISKRPSGVGYCDWPGGDAERAPELHPVVELEPVRAAPDHDHLADRRARDGRPGRARARSGSGPRRWVFRLLKISRAATSCRSRRPSWLFVTNGFESRSSRRESTGARSNRCASVRDVALDRRQRRATFSGTFRPGSVVRAWRDRVADVGRGAELLRRHAERPLADLEDERPARRTPSPGSVASAGERPPTSTWLATVTPAAIVVGRGGIGVGVGVGGGVGVGVGACGVGVGAVPSWSSVVPSSAVAAGLAASSTAERTPAAPHAAKRRKSMPRRFTAQCSHGRKDPRIICDHRVDPGRLEPLDLARVVDRPGPDRRAAARARARPRRARRRRGGASGRPRPARASSAGIRGHDRAAHRDACRARIAGCSARRSRDAVAVLRIREADREAGRRGGDGAQALEVERADDRRVRRARAG